jgi:DNA-binding transcriptional MerR regulator
MAAVVGITGLSEHVLRAWERRHGAIVPTRSAGGTRRYSFADVARLRLLAAAVAAGYPIRDVAALSNGDLAARAARPTSAEHSRLEELFAALARLDVAAVERQLGLQLSALGVRPFLETIALPFLREVGSRWQAGELHSSDEHAASAALRGVLSRAKRNSGGSSAGGLVLATPAGERHELGILMVALCAEEHGVRVVYLGCDLPAAEIASVAERTRAQAVGLGLVGLDPASALREVRALRRKLPRAIELWLGGSAAERLPGHAAGTCTVPDLAALETRLALLGARARRNPA